MGASERLRVGRKNLQCCSRTTYSGGAAVGAGERLPRYACGIMCLHTVGLGVGSILPNTIACHIRLSDVRTQPVEVNPVFDLIKYRCIRHIITHDTGQKALRPVSPNYCANDLCAELRIGSVSLNIHQRDLVELGVRGGGRDAGQPNGDRYDRRRHWGLQ